jgi:hypothetical protein
MMREMTGTEELCRKCDKVVGPATRVCTCGLPTDRATFKERADYELKLWRSYRKGNARA